MVDSDDKWSWQLPELKRKSVEEEDNDGGDDFDFENDWGRVFLPTVAPPVSTLSRRHSISTTAEASRHRPAPLPAKLHQLKQKVSTAQVDILELRQEVSDLQEYSNAKISRVTRYLGVLAEKAQKLDQITMEHKAIISPLVKQKKELFNSLVAFKGNLRVLCRVRPPFEYEEQSATEFPDNNTVRVTLSGESLETKRDYEFDRVCGPHVSQGDFFQEVQPLVQSALDGYNVCIFAFGQTGSGKTHTMEGPSHDRGLYFRCFEELFDLSNSENVYSSSYSFYVSMFQLYNEKVYDLLCNCNGSASLAEMETIESLSELTQTNIGNPTDFAVLVKRQLQSYGVGFDGADRRNNSHLMIILHIHCLNTFTGEESYSKLSLVELAGSDPLKTEEATGEQLTELLHVNKSISVLGDVLSALAAKKDNIPYANSKMTMLLRDSLVCDSKALMVVHISPSARDVQATISSLNFASRIRGVELSLGNRDTIKKWRDMANETRKELCEKEKEISELNIKIIELKNILRDSDEQCLLLYSEVQKAWKVAFTLQADVKTESVLLAEKQRTEKEQNAQLRNQVAHLLKIEQDQKLQLEQHASAIQILKARIEELEDGSADVQSVKDKEMDRFNNMVSENASAASSVSVAEISSEKALVIARLERELLKRDELIKRLHDENEKLFERVTEPTTTNLQVASSTLDVKECYDSGSSDSFKDVGEKIEEKNYLTTKAVAIVEQDSESVKSTAAGEYLRTALLDFDPLHYDNPAAIADGANKLLMLVLAAVIKAGAAREHDMLAEIRDPVFAFIRRLEGLKVMDAMLVSRVRILYIRSLLNKSPELQSVKACPVEQFLIKGLQRSSSSRSSSPRRSPIRYPSNGRKDMPVNNIQRFKVNIRQEKKSKFSSIVLKIRGIDQETWQQHTAGDKLRELTEDARNYAIGNKDLAAVFVHIPAGELQRQIRAWLAENFDFLCVTEGETSNAPGQLEVLSTAIMDGWMAGLGVPQCPKTDALGQLLSSYTKQVYSSQLQHLKDVAGTLATEQAENLHDVSKLRSALDSIDHKRRKILQRMRTDVALLSKEEGGSPVVAPPTSTEDSRLASLILFENVMKQIEAIKKKALTEFVSESQKKELLDTLAELSSQTSSLLPIDHPSAHRHLANTMKLLQSIDVQSFAFQRSASGSSQKDPLLDASHGVMNNVTQWSVLQFNTGSSATFVIKCGATSNGELLVKSLCKPEDKRNKETVKIVPKPAVLTNLNLEEMKQIISQLPESLSQLALARTAEGTRARYSRLYKTLAMRVPSMKSFLNKLEKDESSSEIVNPTPSNRQAYLPRKFDSYHSSGITQ